jgi:hypothetical protein
MRLNDTRVSFTINLINFLFGVELPSSAVGEFYFYRGRGGRYREITARGIYKLEINRLWRLTAAGAWASLLIDRVSSNGFRQLNGSWINLTALEEKVDDSHPKKVLIISIRSSFVLVF